MKNIFNHHYFHDYLGNCLVDSSASHAYSFGDAAEWTKRENGKGGIDRAGVFLGFWRRTKPNGEHPSGEEAGAYSNNLSWGISSATPLPAFRIRVSLFAEF
jgi:hypothetical protein